jgi:hypothetical protein
MDTDVWRTQAACIDLDPERFVPCESRDQKVRAADLADKQHLANTYCATCPAVRGCAAFADRHQYIGLWGGSLRTNDVRGDGYTVTPLTPNAPRSRT